MTLPLMMAGLQESQPLSWLLNGDNHHLMLPSEPKYMPFRWVNLCMKLAFSILHSFFDNALVTEADCTYI